MSRITTKDGRFYEWRGERFPSVTTILSGGVPKPALIRWSARFVAEGAVKQQQTWLSMPELDAIDYLAGLPDKKSRSAANLGTVIHAAAEKYSKGEELVKEVSPVATEYLNGFQKFLIDYKPQYLYTEAPVFNRHYGYAGTLDSIVKIGRTVWILDTKTGKRVYPEAALQLSAYRNAEFIGRNGDTDISELPLPRITKGGVLHLYPNGYTLIPVRIDEEVFEVFLAAKDMYHWSYELSKVVLREPLGEIT